MFRLATTWELPTTAERAWEVIADVERWPAWWPGVVQSRIIRPPGPDGLGQRIHLVVRSPLGYALRFGVEITGMQAPVLAHARVVGGLVGDGSWSVTPTPTGCRATIRWHVSPAREPLRSISRSFARPLAWAHRFVMGRGERGVVGLLDRQGSHLETMW